VTDWSDLADEASFGLYFLAMYGRRTGGMVVVGLWSRGLRTH
jgi:hypothetical protein